jgi:hypothetical protein
VQSDGTDQDGDGQAGIEPGERVIVRYAKEKYTLTGRKHRKNTLHYHQVTGNHSRTPTSAG